MIPFRTIRTFTSRNTPRGFGGDPDGDDVWDFKRFRRILNAVGQLRLDRVLRRRFAGRSETGRGPDIFVVR